MVGILWKIHCDCETGSRADQCLVPVRLWQSRRRQAGNFIKTRLKGCEFFRVYPLAAVGSIADTLLEPAQRQSIVSGAQAEAMVK